MRTSTIALFICVALIAADASFIERLLNRMRWNGKVLLDTSNGVNVGYNASLGLNHGPVDIELADLGARFRAVPVQRAPGAGYNANYKYNGGVHIKHKEHEANVTVDGVAGVALDYNVTKDEKAHLTDIEYTKAITNQNNWKVAAGDMSAAGTHNGSLNAVGSIVAHNQDIMVHHDIQGNVITNGEVTKNDTSVGNFSLKKNGQAAVDALIILHGHDEKMKLKDDFKPTATFLGAAVFNKSEAAGWNNDTYEINKAGFAGFSGHAMDQHKKYQNATWTGLSVVKDVDYQYAVDAKKNGANLGNGTVKGEVKTAYGVGITKNDNGTIDMDGAGNGGMSESTVFDPAEGADYQEVLKLAQRLGLVHNGTLNETRNEEVAKTITSWITAAWNSAHKGRIVHNDTQAIVDANKAVAYSAKGWDSYHNKTWTDSGNITSEAHFEIEKTQDNLHNIRVNVRENPSFLEKIDEISKKLEELRRGN